MPDPQLRDELARRFSRQGRARLRLRRWLRLTSWLVLVQPALALKRIVDVAVSLAVLLLFLPVWTPVWIYAKVRGRGLAGEPRLGRFCAEFRRLSFDFPPRGAGRLLRFLRLHRLPVFFNVLRGDMSLVGPRAAAPGEMSPRDRDMRGRYNVRPGLLCLWWIRSRVSIGYGTEAAADLEYAESSGLMTDLGIALRAVPAVLFGGGVASAPPEITILGIRMDNLTMAEAIERVFALARGTRPRQVCFVNPHCANVACREPSYREALDSADLNLIDGIGIKIAGKLLRREIRQNVNGTDLFPRLLSALQGTGEGVFLLGGQPGVADAVRRWAEENHPGATICGTRHGYFTPGEEEAVVAEVAASGAAILLVAFGVPRQDVWIARNLAALKVPVAMGVGGLFDFYSGRIPRAPQWMREMGLEWVFRLLQEPGRMWKRYLVGNLVFLSRVLREKVTGRVPGSGGRKGGR